MKDQEWKYNQKAEDAWQVLRIQGEFIKGFDIEMNANQCIKYILPKPRSK